MPRSTRFQFKCDVLWSMLDAIHQAYAKQITDNARPRLARGVRLQIDARTGKGGAAFSGRHSRIERNGSGNPDPLRRTNDCAIFVCELAEEYDVDPTTLAADVRETLADLQRRKLVELHERTPSIRLARRADLSLPTALSVLLQSDRSCETIGN